MEKFQKFALSQRNSMILVKIISCTTKDDRNGIYIMLEIVYHKDLLL